MNGHTTSEGAVSALGCSRKIGFEKQNINKKTRNIYLLDASSSESKKLVVSMSLLITDDVASMPCALCRL